jgi:hypothetical protein
VGLDFAWLSNNLDTAYPFRTPAPVFDLGGTQRSLGNIIADAKLYTSIEDEAHWKLYSFDLTFAWPAVPTQGVIRVQSDTGEDITLNGLHTDTDFTAWLYGSWLVTEWVKIVATPAGFTDYDIVVRILWSADALDAFGSLSKSETDWGDPAWFEETVIRQGPRRVRRAFYKAGVLYTPLGSELRLAGGFNTDLTVKQDGDAVGFRADADESAAVRPETALLLAMPPGGGTGKYLRCEPQDLLRTINGLGPDEQGNFHLNPKECYWLERPLLTDPVDGGEQVDKQATVYPNRLQLHSACEECCSCEAYVDVYENLQRVWAQAHNASGRIYQALEEYKDLRLEFLVRTKGGQLVIKTGIVSSPGLSLSVAALVVNGGDTDVAITDEVLIELDFTSSPDDFDVEYVNKTGLATVPPNERKYIDPEQLDETTFELDMTGVALAPGQQILWVGQFTVSPNASVSRASSNITLTEKLKVNGTLTDADSQSVELKPAEERE